MEQMAVVIIETEKDKYNEYIPCIVKKGVQGYFPTTWTWGTNLKIARKLADEYNARLGVTPEEAMTLTLESMREDVKKHLRTQGE